MSVHHSGLVSGPDTQHHHQPLTQVSHLSLSHSPPTPLLSGLSSLSMEGREEEEEEEQEEEE